MAYQFGTNSALDTLASSQQTIPAFGEDKAFEAITMALAAHNAVTADMLGTLAERSPDRLRRTGGNTQIGMQQLDEHGTPNPQKVTAGVNIGFPLYLFAIALQWTRTYLRKATTLELAGQVQAVMQADLLTIQRQVKLALFTPTNNLTYVDKLVDSVVLPLRALANADSAAIPPDPYGAEFNAATHTHYLGTASFVAADLTAVIETVVEHGLSGSIRVDINRAQETAIRGFNGFTAYIDARVIPATSTSVAMGDLNQDTLYNRPIGIFGAAEIWVKPWIPAGYVLAYRIGDPPLLFRTDTTDDGNLTLVYEDEVNPLRARAWERRFGVSVARRTEAAVLLTTATPYVAPTL